MKSSLLTPLLCFILGSTILSFAQPCPVKSIPFVEDFEGSQYTSGPPSYGPGTIDSCWIRESGDYFWRIHDAQMNHSASTGANHDHTTGIGQYAFTDLSNSVTGGLTTYFVSPWIFLDTAANPQLTYFVHRYGLGINNLKVLVTNGGGIWNQVDILTGPNQTSASSRWEKRVVNLSSYAGDTIRLNFTGSRTPSTSSAVWQVDMCIDDISVTASSICAQPQSLINTYLGATKASFKWVSGGANNFQVLYGPTGFNLNNGTLLNNSDTSVVLNGLTSNTTYDLYVRDSCGPNTLSGWIGPLTFTTSCMPAITPYSENFDDSVWVVGNYGMNVGNLIPSCWSRPSNGHHFGPFSGSTHTLSTGPQSDVSGNGKYLYIDGSAGSSLTPKEITSEDIYIASGSLNPKLKFYYFMYGSGITSLSIEIGKNGNFTPLKSIYGQQHFSSTANWKSDSVSLTSYIGDTIQIKIIGVYSNVIGDIAIDELSITAQCQPVIAAFSPNRNILEVNFSSSTTTGADSLLWDFGDSTYSTSHTPIHTYDSAGSYTIKLIATNDCGNSDTTSQTIHVCDSIIPNITLSQDEDTIFFDATGSVGATTYYWNLGDGTDTSGAYVSHLYAHSGNKIIRLIAVNDCGDSVTVQNNILVCWPPKARWNYTVLNTTSAGMKVLFDGSASKNATSYYWDFGDGNIDSSSLAPIHTYTSPGLHYEVSLQVKNNCKQINTMKVRLSEIGLHEFIDEKSITIYPNPASHTLTIEWPQNNLDVNSIKIYEAGGKKIWQESPKRINDTQLEIDVSSIPSGIYILEVNTHIESHKTQLFIK